MSPSAQTSNHLDIAALCVRIWSPVNPVIDLHWTMEACRKLSFDGRANDPTDTIMLLSIQKDSYLSDIYVVDFSIGMTKGLKAGHAAFKKKTLLLREDGYTPGGTPVFQLFSPVLDDTCPSLSRPEPRKGYCTCGGEAVKSFIGMVGGGYWVTVCHSCIKEKDPIITPPL